LRDACLAENALRRATRDCAPFVAPTLAAPLFRRDEITTPPMPPPPTRRVTVFLHSPSHVVAPRHAADALRAERRYFNEPIRCRGSRAPRFRAAMIAVIHYRRHLSFRRHTPFALHCRYRLIGGAGFSDAMPR